MFLKNHYQLTTNTMNLKIPINKIHSSHLTKNTKPDLTTLRRPLWSILVLYTLVQSPLTNYYLTKCPIFYAAI